MKQLYSIAELAGILDISRQAAEKALAKGRIEPNEYVTGESDKRVKGWTEEQVKRIKRAFVITGK